MKQAKLPRARTAQQLTRLLNLSDEDAVEIDLRVELNDKIIAVVKRRRLTHAAVAELAHTSRTKITALLSRNTRHIINLDDDQGARCPRHSGEGVILHH